MHNTLLQFTVALNILYRQISAAEMQVGVIKQPNTYV